MTMWGPRFEETGLCYMNLVWRAFLSRTGLELVFRWIIILTTIISFFVHTRAQLFDHIKLMYVLFVVICICDIC